MASAPTGTLDHVDIGGRRLAVWRAGGSGPAVLLVHGIPTRSTLWQDVVPVLERDAQVLAVDLLGFGRSDPPDGWPVDIASQARYVARMLDELDAGPVTVVGHDLGGGVAQILAVTQPERVTALGVVDGVCYDGWPVPLVRAAKAVWPLVAVTPPAALPALLRPALRTLFASPAAADAFLDGFVAPWGLPDGPASLAAHLRALDSVFTQTVAPFLDRIKVPTEVLWGAQDHQMKPVYGRRLARDIPEARLTVVDGASHFVPADRPDAVVEAVGRLLERAAVS